MSGIWSLEDELKNLGKRVDIISEQVQGIASIVFSDKLTNILENLESRIKTLEEQKDA